MWYTVASNVVNNVIKNVVKNVVKNVAKNVVENAATNMTTKTNTRATTNSASTPPPPDDKHGLVWRRVPLPVRIPFALRLFLLYFVFVALTGYLVLHLLTEQVKPGFRQASEETLIDASQHLADLVSPYVQRNTLQDPTLQQLLRNYGRRSVPSQLWGYPRHTPDYRLYITDDRGIVLFDSDDVAVGQDYSKWNDVYKTLRGEYGARSSKASADANAPSMMHIAAPIRQPDGTLIGVLTLAKSNGSLQPFIDRSQRYLLERGLLLMLLGLLIGGLLTWRLQRGLNRLRHYITNLNAGLRVPPPKFRLFYEFGDLAVKLDTLRGTLEGKTLRDTALQTLTHELKSPLTAIRAATEILASGSAAQPLPDAVQQKFLGHIRDQSDRLTHLSERLLQISSLEQLPHLPDPQPLHVGQLLAALQQQNQAQLDAKALQWHMHIQAPEFAHSQATQPRSPAVMGDSALVQQALQHLLDNALDFTPHGGWIRAELKVVACADPQHPLGGDHRAYLINSAGLHNSTSFDNSIRHPNSARRHSSAAALCLSIANQGPPIPDYALGRVCEKFYSLPRPAADGVHAFSSAAGKKSTGLGLSFVEQVMQLHHGQLQIQNLSDGVEVRLYFPFS